MKWSKVRLILQREIRDQLRDRRTLFMIAILPLMLYPILGMGLLQVGQFLKEHPSKVWVVGVDQLPDDQPDELQLIDDDRFNAQLLAGDKNLQDLIHLYTEMKPLEKPIPMEQRARMALTEGGYDAVIEFPTDFGQRLKTAVASEDDENPIPNPVIHFSAAKDRSRIAQERIKNVLHVWRGRLSERSLESKGVSLAAARPFDLEAKDVSEDNGRRAALWSKFLPFVLLVWALNGAFYPAIDLCAGEKERGTLETLLSSPAERREIVWGKLLTIMLFSAATSLLNLISLGLTATFVVGNLAPVAQVGDVGFGPPPVSVLAWLLIALVPISALFSALSLALAAMARSSKEGQYYLMPLFLVTMPLMMLSILPTVELELGTALIPVTGVMLILRNLIEGDYALAFKYAMPVVFVTGICCWLSIRWAVRQFNDESVLFRESERFSLGLWLIHIVRDKAESPTFAQAIMCGVLLLSIRFFTMFALPGPESWYGLVKSTLIVQLAFVATPVFLMAIMLTSHPRRSMGIKRTRPMAVFAAALLAILLHPAANLTMVAIQSVYPLSSQAIEQLAPVLSAIEAAPLPVLLLLLAVTPAICEELAFRGFMLSGLRRIGSRWTAILISSIFFGVIHGILQQSLNAFLLGMLLGYIAIQSGSILPCIAYHMIHNGLAVLSTRLTEATLERNPHFAWIFNNVDGTYVVQLPITIVCSIAALMIIVWFRSLPFQRTEEEQLQDALDHQSATMVAG